MHDDVRGLPPAARRARIHEVIARRGFALVADLARAFQVSEVTVRTDLDALAAADSVARVRGGAMAINRVGATDSAFSASALTRADEKERIATATARFIESHQVVAIDAGTTTTAVARALVLRHELENITVVTNSINIALELESAVERITVVVTGGTLHSPFHALVDPLADSVLERVRADIAILGCNGADADAGITNSLIGEADMKRRMLSSAARTIVVADSSKLGVVRASRVCAVTDISVLVTSAEAPVPPVRAITDRGLHVVRA